MLQLGLQLMSIEDIMRNAKGSVDIGNRNGEIDWWGIFSAKVSNGHFDAVVDEIQTNGFGMPIVLCDRYSNGNYVIGNGHHRLSAAILLGLWRIPVIVSEGSDRDDFMQQNDSMDDYGRPIDYVGTWEYWELLQGNMESGDYSNAWEDEESDHPQFYCDWCGEYFNNSTYCCEECHNDDAHPRCDHCEERECGTEHADKVCDHCDVTNPDDWSDHLIGCPEWNWHIHECADPHGMRHYAYAECKACMDARHGDALDEHAQFLADMANYERIGAIFRDGMWHPAYILAEAYAEEEAFEANRPLREARQYWESRVKVMREAVLAGHYSDDYLSICAVDVAEARAAYLAL